MRSFSVAAVLTAGIALVLAGPVAAAEGEWGTVKGQITWGGAGDPPQKNENITKDQAHCLSKGPVPNLEYVVGKSGGVKNVFVWLVDAQNPKKKLPIHPALAAVKVKEVVMDQPCCKFEPRCLALREGQTLIGKNS